MRTPTAPGRDHARRSALHSTLAMALLIGLAAPRAAHAEPDAAPAPEIEEIRIVGSRLDVGLAGASTTLIEREEIALTPARTLPELLSLQAGVQSRDLLGGTAGSRASIDLRGFGATGTQNALLLVDGRRLNDIDLAAIDYANIPRESIERIEITRGAAGAVLYGDGAVGGVINILTRPGATEGATGRVRFTTGSDGYRQTDVSAELPFGAYSFSSYGTLISGDGYRENSDIEQRNLVVELRRSDALADVFVELGLDDQDLGLPGPQRVLPDGTSGLDAHPRGTATPFDWADQSGISLSLGGRRWLSDGVEVTLDAGLRRKRSDARFIDISPWGIFKSYIDTELQNVSVTPRLRIRRELGGIPVESIIGVDYYRARYDSERKESEHVAPVHRYTGHQQTVGVYAQNSLELSPDTELSVGARVQYIGFDGQDRLDPAAPAGAWATGDDSLRQDDLEYAIHLGLEQRLTDEVAVFGRVGRSFRLPTIDERIGGRGGSSLDLDIQRSVDAEIGVRYQAGALRLDASAYAIRARDELYFRGDAFVNENLDPTRRLGAEASATLDLAEGLRLIGTLAYTRAKFTDGPLDGKNVPLVSPRSASLSAFWDLSPQAEDVLDALEIGATLRYADERRLENDTLGMQNDRVPDRTLVDARLTGSLGALELSITATNLLNREYYEYGVASAFTPGVYNAYPLPGRNFLFSIGVTY